MTSLQEPKTELIVAAEKFVRDELKGQDGVRWTVSRADIQASADSTENPRVHKLSVAVNVICWYTQRTLGTFVFIHI